MNTIHYMILGAKSPTGRNYMQTLALKGVDAKNIIAIDSKTASMSYGDDDVIPVFDSGAYKNHAMRKIALVVLAEAKAEFIAIADQHLDDGLRLLDITGHFIDDPDAVLAPAEGMLVVQPSVGARAVAKVIKKLAKTPTALHVHTLLPVSTFGKEGMDELFQQVRQFLVTDELDAGVFPKKIAFNVIPYAGDLGDDGTSAEEHRMSVELRKLLPDLQSVFISTAIVPVFIGLSLNITLQFAKGQAPDMHEAMTLLRTNKTIRIIDPSSELVTASPAEISGDDGLFVSRLHNPAHMPDALSMWVMVDNTIF